MFYLGTWLKINSNPVCFGAHNDTYGSFTIGKTGFISALKLVHKSGILVCHEKSTRSYWGCKRPCYGDKTLMTVITYSNKSMFLPSTRTAKMTKPSMYPLRASEYTYHLDNFDDVSPEIIFNLSSKALQVSVMAVPVSVMAWTRP